LKDFNKRKDRDEELLAQNQKAFIKNLRHRNAAVLALGSSLCPVIFVAQQLKGENCPNRKDINPLASMAPPFPCQGEIFIYAANNGRCSMHKLEMSIIKPTSKN